MCTTTAAALLLLTLSNAPGTLADEVSPGLLVRLYDIGQSVPAIPDLLPGQTPNAVKIVPTLDLDGARGDFAPLADRFMTEVTGFLVVREPGTYGFRLISDDGARLWIDGEIVVDHDGLHGATPKDGHVTLTAGTHELRVLHFESGGGEQLTLLWSTPGLRKAVDFVRIPPENLVHDADASRATSPGTKRIVPPLRRGRPGDGSPVDGRHPSFSLSRVGERALRSSPLPPPDLTVLSEVPASPPSSYIWLPPSVEPVDGVSLAPVRVEPYAGQWLAAAESTGCLRRVFVEQEDDLTQGCVFRFGQLGGRGSVLLPREDALLLRGSVDSPTGSGLLQKMERSDRKTFEMLAVRALTNGFEIEFTKPLDPRVGWDPESYYVEQWPFDMARGQAPTRDGSVVPVRSASVSPDRRKVFLEIPSLAVSRVIYLRLAPPCLSEDGELPWSTEAWYTLWRIPQDRPGVVLSPPAQPPQNILTPDEKASGWTLLFDGETTNGWRGYKKDRFPEQGWKVRGGCLVRLGSGGDICTVQQFDNFELKIEWRIAAAGNSGIFFRVSEELGWAWESAPEMQVLDNAEHVDGRNPKTSAGSNYAVHAPIRDVTQPVGLFNAARIVVNGDHVEHWLNGVKVVEYELGSPAWERLVAESKFKDMPHYGRVARGHIVLQDHGDRVWYRNIKIRPLGKGAAGR